MCNLLIIEADLYNLLIMEADLYKLLTLSALNVWEYLIYVVKRILIDDVVESTMSPKVIGDVVLSTKSPITSNR